VYNALIEGMKRAGILINCDLNPDLS
jgi:hypothetical protein